MPLIDEPLTQHGRHLYEPEPAEVVYVQKLTSLENLYSLRFQTGDALGHGPGQFVQVSILGVGVCTISICSSPTRPGA